MTVKQYHKSTFQYQPTLIATGRNKVQRTIFLRGFTYRGSTITQWVDLIYKSIVTCSDKTRTKSACYFGDTGSLLIELENINFWFLVKMDSLGIELLCRSRLSSHLYIKQPNFPFVTHCCVLKVWNLASFLLSFFDHIQLFIIIER